MLFRSDNLRVLNVVPQLPEGNVFYWDDVEIWGMEYDPVIAEDGLRCGDAGTWYLSEDLNQDCYVDFRDFAMFVQSWLYR